MVRVSTLRLEGWGSIPGRVILNTLKMGPMPPRLRLSIRGWIGRIDYWARVMGCFKEQPRLFSLKMISQRLETQNSSTAYQLKQLTVGSHDLKTM